MYSFLHLLHRRRGVEGAGEKERVRERDTRDGGLFLRSMSTSSEAIAENSSSIRTCARSARVGPGVAGHRPMRPSLFREAILRGYSAESASARFSLSTVAVGGVEKRRKKLKSKKKLAGLFQKKT